MTSVTYQKETQRAAAIHQRTIVAKTMKQRTHKQTCHNYDKLIAGKCQQVQRFHIRLNVGHVQRYGIDNQFEKAISQSTGGLNAQLFGRETLLQTQHQTSYNHVGYIGHGGYVQVGSIDIVTRLNRILLIVFQGPVLKKIKKEKNKLVNKVTK